MNRSVTWAAWIIVFWGFVQAGPFLIPLLLAALLAFLMSPIVEWLRRRKVPEGAAVGVAALLLFLPTLALVALLTSEGSVLVRDYPQLMATAKSKWAELAASPWAERLNLSEYLDTASLSERLSDEAGKGVSFLIASLKALAEAGAHLLIILFFSVLMIASRAPLRKSAEKLLTDAATLDEIVNLVQKFLIARIGIAIAVALIDFVILKSMGSKYGVLFGCILGLSTFIPVVGFVIGVLPPLALGLATGISPLKTGLLALLLYVVATVEAHFVTPKYLGRQLNLNLLITFMALFAGELLWGVWGMVLSLPLLGILRILMTASDRFRPWAGFLAENKDAHH